MFGVASPTPRTALPRLRCSAAAWQVVVVTSEPGGIRATSASRAAPGRRLLRADIHEAWRAVSVAAVHPVQHQAVQVDVEIGRRPEAQRNGVALAFASTEPGYAVLRLRAHRSGVVLYSHSIVAGGFPEMSYATREMPFTSFTMRSDTRSRKSYGSAHLRRPVDGAEEARLELRPNRRVYVHVACGSVTANGAALAAGDALKLTDVTELELVRGTDAEVIAFDLPGQTQWLLERRGGHAHGVTDGVVGRIEDLHADHLVGVVAGHQPAEIAVHVHSQAAQRLQ